jgi:hypothetical protein
MSPWGAFLLRNCNNNLALDLSPYWFFPSELAALSKCAEAIGIKLFNKCKNRGTFEGGFYESF